MNVIALLIVISIVGWLGGMLVLWKPIMRKVKETKIYACLKENTEDEAGKQFRTADEIGQALGIPKEKVREICASSTRIFKCPDKEDSWTVFDGQ